MIILSLRQKFCEKLIQDLHYLKLSDYETRENDKNKVESVAVILDDVGMSVCGM